MTMKILMRIKQRTEACGECNVGERSDGPDMVKNTSKSGCPEPGVPPTWPCS